MLLEVGFGTWISFSCRFFDSRESLGKTPSELNRFVSLLDKEHYISIPVSDFSLEVAVSSEQQVDGQRVQLSEVEATRHTASRRSVDGKEASKEVAFMSSVHCSKKLRQACEEQRGRLEHLQKELESATTGEREVSLQSQLKRETSILEERSFFVVPFQSLDRSVKAACTRRDRHFKSGPSSSLPFLLSSSLQEALQSTGVSACSTDNILFLADLTDVTLPPPPEQAPQSAQNVFFINLGVSSLAQTSFVTSPQHAPPFHWTIIPHSLPLLSSLLPTPLVLPPPPVPPLPQHPAVITLEETSLAEGVCVDLQRLAKESVAEESTTVTIEPPTEQLVRSREGVRMVYMEAAPSAPAVRAERTKLRLRVESLIDCHEMICDTLLRTPFMVLVAKAPAFTQFMRSLVMDHRLAFGVVENEGEGVDLAGVRSVDVDTKTVEATSIDMKSMDTKAVVAASMDIKSMNTKTVNTESIQTNPADTQPNHSPSPSQQPKPLTFLLFPFTDTSAYLFLPNGAGSLSGFSEATCDTGGTTDLVYWWTQALEKSGTPQVLPGDLLAYNCLRKTQSEERKQEEEPILMELREKLEMADLEKASKAEGLLHVGDLKVLLRSQLEEAWDCGRCISSRYRAALGQMQRDVDVFLERLEAIRAEFRGEVDDTTLRERIVESVGGLVLTKEELRAKYGVR